MATSVKSFCRLSARGSALERFAVFLGRGVYLSSYQMSAAHLSDFIHFGGVSRAAPLDRNEAIKACHAVRKVGLNAWVVPHQNVMVSA